VVKVKRISIIVIFLLCFTLFSCTSSESAKNQSAVPGMDYVPTEPDRENDMPVQPMGGKSAMDYLRDEKIYSGINIGNTLDAHTGGKGNELGWGNPRINQTYMNGIKAAGFDIVRIPVTWSGHYTRGPDFRINQDQLERVAAVVDMAHEAGLKVIINIHHDGSEGTKFVNWQSLEKAYRSADGYRQVTFQFVRLWKQIALYFKNYGDWLIFQSMNEMHDGYWGNSDFMTILLQYRIINGWNQIFTDIVRKSGGNNESRYLLIPGYAAKAKLTVSEDFILPADTAQDKLIVGFHYYDPYQFGQEGTRSNWGTDADKKQVDDDFAPFVERFMEKNVPVIMDECGAVLQLYPNDSDREARARQSRRDYLLHVFSTARKYGIVPVYWDNGITTGNGEKFGLINRRTGQPNSPESDALIKMMINAARR
jgi:endoglucanase